MTRVCLVTNLGTLTAMVRQKTTSIKGSILMTLSLVLQNAAKQLQVPHQA